MIHHPRLISSANGQVLSTILVVAGFRFPTLALFEIDTTTWKSVAMAQTFRLAPICLALIHVFWFIGTAGAADWNQWRGPNRNSQLLESDWPDSVNGRLEEVWTRPHGPTYSGPVVSNGIVYTTETVDKSFERVTAYRLDDGEEVWSVKWDGAMAVPFFAAENGDWIRSTPACDGKHLVVLGMRDVLVCLNPETGAESWRVDFPSQAGTPLPSFGAVCSPLIDGQYVYVQSGGALACVALADGSIQWQTLEKGGSMMTNGAFSSPVIATLSGVRQLVVQTRSHLCGVSLEDGQVLWMQPVEAFRGMNILTPLVSGDRIFTAAHSGKSQLFEVRRSEDSNWSVSEVWSQKLQGYMSSPVLIGDTIFLHQKNNRLSALSLKDGTIHWTTSPEAKYWSMVASGNKILALTNEGNLMLINGTEKEFDRVDRKKVADDSWAHLAIQDNYVIVRDLAALKVFRWK